MSDHCYRWWLPLIVWIKPWWKRHFPTFSRRLLCLRLITPSLLSLLPLSIFLFLFTLASHQLFLPRSQYSQSPSRPAGLLTPHPSGNSRRRQNQQLECKCTIISASLRERADQDKGKWSDWESGGEIEKMCEEETSRLIMCDNQPLSPPLLHNYQHAALSLLGWIHTGHHIQ